MKSLTHPQEVVKRGISSCDTIEILEFRTVPGRSAVKAECRVRVGQIVIGGVKVLLPALASRPFVGMPSRRNGAEWEPLVNVLSPTLQQNIFDAVLAAWRMASRTEVSE